MAWLARLVNVMRRDRVNRDIEDEIQYHLDARVDEFWKAGLSPHEARQRAVKLFGNPLALREASRDIRLLPRVESMLRDAGFGLRLCRRYKAVTATAILSLSLAIGACAAGFSLVYALMLRTLPVEHPESLIHLAVREPSAERDGLSFNFPLFRDMRDAGRSYISLFALSDQRRDAASFDDSGQPEQVQAQWVSGDTFRVLGITPSLGRLLEASDDVYPGQHPVAVLSYDFWTRRFGGQPDVLGRWVTVRGTPLQVVGVAGKRFTGVQPGLMTDLWAPTMMWHDRSALADSGARWLQIWGRVHGAVAEPEARAVLQPVFSNFQREQAAMRPAESRERIAQLLGTRLHLRSSATGVSNVREDFARPLWVLVGIAALVLLIACTNVASLLLGRAAAREREMALRVSIGAGRGRLVQQVLIESALLVLASCILGGIFARAAAPAIVSMLSTTRTVVQLDVQTDWRVLLFLGCVGAVVTLLFGLAPARRAAAVRPAGALTSETGRHTAVLRGFRPLLVGQVAISFVVLFVAGLCLTSFVKLLRTDPGFDSRHLALVKVSVEDATATSTVPPAAWRTLLDRLQAIPGVDSTSLSAWGLFQGSGRNKSVQMPDRAADAYRPWYLPISPGFLRTMNIALVAGRDIEWQDVQSAPTSAVIVNESFARRYFPGESPVGKRFFRIDGGETLVAQDIIGIARDAMYTSLREPAPPTVYNPYRAEETAVLQIRTRLDQGALTVVIREELERGPEGLRLEDVTLQSTLVDSTLVRDRALALLSLFFSLVAMALVAVGLYGTLAYSLRQRTREIGIRLALGASPRRAATFVLSELMTVAVAGVAVGGAGAWFASGLVTPVLFAVSRSDLWSVAVPLACLLACCAVSAVVPTLRATRIDPSRVLRSD